MNNCTSERTEAFAPVDVAEKALRDEGISGERVLTVGTLIFSIAFCTLFFWAGWKEVSLIEGCGWNNKAHCSEVVLVPRIEN